MDQLTWTALAAVIIGGVVRSLKTDQFKTTLAQFGLPPIPTRALPFVALGLGAVAALLSAKAGGSSWSDAGKAGLVAASGAVFGHELLSGVPGVNKLLGVVFLVVGVSATTQACTPKARAILATNALDVAACVLEHAKDPDLKQAAIFCATKEVSPAEVLQMLTAQKAALANAEAKAAAEAAEVAAARAAASCVGQGPYRSTPADAGADGGN